MLSSTSHKVTADSAITEQRTGWSSLRILSDGFRDVMFSSSSDRPFFIALFRHLNYVGRKGEHTHTHTHTVLTLGMWSYGTLIFTSQVATEQHWSSVNYCWGESVSYLCSQGRHDVDLVLSVCSLVLQAWTGGGSPLCPANDWLLCYQSWGVRVPSQPVQGLGGEGEGMERVRSQSLNQLPTRTS